jgi:integrase
VTVDNLVDAFLDDRAVDPSVREVTLYNYRGTAKKVRKELGPIHAQALTRKRVVAFVNECAAEGLSQRTVTEYLWILKSALQMGVDNEQLVKNVAQTVKSKGRPPQPRRALTVEEWDKFVDVINDNDAAGAWWLTLLGLRRSEVMALTWADIDLKTRTVNIRKGRVMIDGKRQAVGDTKTRAGYRQIVVPQEVADALSEMRTRQMERFGLLHAREGHIVVDHKGAPLRPERWSDSFKAIAGKIEAEGVTLHSARHTAVTLMRARGGADHAVAQFVGHDEVVMRRTYTHKDVEGMTRAAELLVRGVPDVTTDVTTGSE